MDSEKPSARHSARYKCVTLTDEERQGFSASLLDSSNIDGGNFVDSVINGDNTEILTLLPDEFADLIVVDPPYNISKRFGSVSFTACTSEAYRRYVDSWLPQVCRKLKPGGSLYLCGDWKCTAALQQSLESCLTVINRITWQREKGRATAHNWKNVMEDIWFAVKEPQNYTFNAGKVMMKRRVKAPYRQDGKPKDWQQTQEGNFRLTGASNFWDDITVPFWSMSENTSHPTQKPEKLLAKLILASSNEGDMVFDPFLGSGTTCVVAKKLGRRFCGIEIDREHCLVALKRLGIADTDKSIQGYSDGVFWERNSYNETKCLARSRNTM